MRRKDPQQSIRFWLEELISTWASSLTKQVQLSLTITHNFKSLLIFIVVEPAYFFSHEQLDVFRLS